MQKLTITESHFTEAELSLAGKQVQRRNFEKKNHIKLTRTSEASYQDTVSICWFFVIVSNVCVWYLVEYRTLCFVMLAIVYDHINYVVIVLRSKLH